MEFSNIELDNIVWMARNTSQTREEIITKVKSRVSGELAFGEFVLTQKMLKQLCIIPITNPNPSHKNGAVNDNKDTLPDKYKEILNCKGLSIIVNHKEFYEDIYDLKFTNAQYKAIFNPPEGIIYEINSQKFWDMLPPEIYTLAKDSNDVFYAYGFASCVYSSYKDKPKQYWGWNSIKPPLFVDFMRDKKYVLDYKHETYANASDSCSDVWHRPNVKKQIFDFHNIDWALIPKIYSTIWVDATEEDNEFKIKCTGNKNGVYYPWQGGYLYNFGYDLINIPTEDAVFIRSYPKL